MKPHKKNILLLLALLTCVVVTWPSAAATSEPVKCLMIGNEPHGDSGVMSEAIADINENYPSVEISVVGKADLEALRYENLQQYDVLLVEQIQVEDGSPPQFVKDGILQFLKDGGGLVVSHFAVANVQQWRDSIDIYGAMWVSGKSTHGPYHEFRVDIVDESHPIVEGVRPFTTTDELYFNLLMRPDVHVIATGNEERFGHTVAEPLLATHYVHNARCVYFALGHDTAACSPPEYRKILAQAIEWAACRR
jgi:type 1 glutamine amidotransferase